jgi:hypothetical protein
MTHLEHALRYARIGWRVLPIYEINSIGTCSCGKPDCPSPGKHPRTRHGLTEATTNLFVIEAWWKQWPTANIAIATGAGSGIVVIDIDGPEGEASMQGHPYPATIEAYTGGGGRHLVYAHPGGCAVKSCTGVLPHVDSRADGGYIVVAPSNHSSGNEYEWRADPFDNIPAPAPDWWIEKLYERPEAKSRVSLANDSRVVSGGRNNHLTAYAGKLRRMGWEHADIVTALYVHNKKTCSPPLDDEEVEQIARSIAGYSVFTPEEEAQIEKGDRAAKVLLENLEKERQAFLKQKKITKKRMEPPKVFVPPRGLVCEIYDWIIETSMYPLPYLAMAASVSFVSILMGQKFQGHTGIKPNLYMVGIAPSGSGKEHARSCIDLLAHRCGLDHLIGGSRIASGSALISALEEYPVQLYQLDEFGLMLQLMTDKNASGHKKELADMMMQFYTVDGIFRGTDYADRKIKKRKPIENPIVSIYGTSTPSEFYKALSSSSGDNGFLRRMTIIDGGDSEPIYGVRKREPPVHLVEAVKDLYKFGGDAANLGHARAVIVNCPDDINEAIRKFNDEIRVHGDEVTQPIYRRATASLMKLALVFSVSMGTDDLMIRHDCFAIARDIVLWSIDVTISALHQHIADSDTERDSKLVENIIRKAGQSGILGSDLYLKTRKIKKYDRENIMADLQNAGIIGQKTELQDGAGRPSQRWIHRDNVEVQHE